MTVYLDYNATHPPFVDLIHAAVDAWGQNHANPSGISYPSQRNQGRLEQARSSVTEQLNRLHKTDMKSDGVLFVSTGTEAVYHMVAAFAQESSSPRALVSPYEHECMYAACHHFGVQVEFLSASPSGCVDLQDVRERLMRGGYSFVAVTALCNETGVIQPLAEIKKAIEESGKTQNPAAQTDTDAVPLLVDSIQASGKSTLDLSAADAFAVNGHKIGAGMGAAAVLLRDPSRFRPIFRGGLQERQRRAGTENVVAILSLEAALLRQGTYLSTAQSPAPFARNRPFHEQIEAVLREDCGAILVAESSARGSTSYAIFPERTNMDFLLMALDRDGILCSTGSSCKSRARQPSNTLLRMGYSGAESLQALRFSSGMYTTAEEIDRFCSVFPELVRKCTS